MYKKLFSVSVVILLSSIIMLLLIPVISNKIYFIALFSFIGYFYLTLFYLSFFGGKISQNSMVSIICLTIFLLQVYTILMWYVLNDLFGLPVVITYFLGVFSAYFYLKSKLPKNLIVFTLSSFFVVFMFFQGWDYWLHKLDYGTFTGRIESDKLQQKVEGIDQHNNKINNQTLESKIVLLDFWHTKCGVCFQKFPQLQTFYDKYKNDDSVIIFAVDKPLDEDKEKSAFKVIEEEGYNFPVLLPTDEDLPEKFGVKGYPTTFVINKQGNVVYKGDIEGAILRVEELKRNG
jgi:thiol-disulfide isomerase/thioredoxin